MTPTNRPGLYALTTLMLIGAGALTSASAADLGIDQIEPAIKYRQNLMKAMAGLAGASVGQIRDGLGFGPDLKTLAQALQSLSRDIPALFPTGTDFGETEAKAEVWSKPDDFKAAAGKLRDGVDAYLAAVEQGDRGAIDKGFKAVGDACKGCHKHFREEHEH